MCPSPPGQIGLKLSLHHIDNGNPHKTLTVVINLHFMESGDQAKERDVPCNFPHVPKGGQNSANIQLQRKDWHSMISLLDCEFTTLCNTNSNFTVCAQDCKNILEDHLLFSQSISGHSSVSAEILILRFPDPSISSCQESSIRADKQILEIASPASRENIYVNMRWWNI